MMMMMMIVIVTVSARHNDDAGRISIIIIISAIKAVVMVMMVVVMIVELNRLDIFVRRLGRSGFIDRLQQRSRIPDRLKQVSEGIGPQDVGRRRTGNWRGLCGIKYPERRHGPQQSSDLFFHLFLQLMLQCALRDFGNAAIERWFLAMMSD
jgi:hypothetical protein